MKSIASCVSRKSPISHSRLLLDAISSTRKAGTAEKAHIIFYDEVHKAIEDSEENTNVLRIVVSPKSPKNLPKGIYWIQSEIAMAMFLVQLMNRGK